jgi:hypothetical protein
LSAGMQFSGKNFRIMRSQRITRTNMSWIEKTRLPARQDTTCHRSVPVSDC